MCDRLLANPVIESYRFDIEELARHLAMSAYEDRVADTSKRLLGASIEVVMKLPGLRQMESQLPWIIQAEIVWTLLGDILRNIDGIAGTEVRTAIRDDLLQVISNELLNAGFGNPADSAEERAARQQSLIDWFNQADADSGKVERFQSTQDVFFVMALTGDIPKDSLLGKLCGRVSGATGQPGNSELIQLLFQEVGDAYARLDIAGLPPALVEARAAS
jgi:hypothetical protein